MEFNFGGDFKETMLLPNHSQHLSPKELALIFCETNDLLGDDSVVEIITQAIQNCIGCIEHFKKHNPPTDDGIPKVVRGINFQNIICNRRSLFYYIIIRRVDNGKMYVIKIYDDNVPFRCECGSK